MPAQGMRPRFIFRAPRARRQFLDLCGSRRVDWPTSREIAPVHHRATQPQRHPHRVHHQARSERSRRCSTGNSSCGGLVSLSNDHRPLTRTERANRITVEIGINRADLQPCGFFSRTVRRLISIKPCGAIRVRDQEVKIPIAIDISSEQAAAHLNGATERIRIFTRIAILTRTGIFHHQVSFSIGTHELVDPLFRAGGFLAPGRLSHPPVGDSQIEIVVVVRIEQDGAVIR